MGLKVVGGLEAIEVGGEERGMMGILMGGTFGATEGSGGRVGLLGFSFIEGSPWDLEDLPSSDEGSLKLRGIGIGAI